MNRFVKFTIILSFCISFQKTNAQPWLSPLNIAFSNDGISFNTPSFFQDSSGVPSVVKWKSDTLVCVFQWFRQPINSPSWDRVAVKFSYNNGADWTTPIPIVVNGLPANFQRPFDPTLTVLSNGKLRVYYSSSNGMPQGNDSIINTYSAISNDGINYTFEANARVDEPTNRVIDPAVVYFKNMWHYLSPSGAPQQGAVHYTSTDGIVFSKVPDIVSDNNHNWTGNYVVNDTQNLRFYGCGTGSIWFNTSTNGGVWNGYTATNIFGGDPSVVKLSNNTYIMIYVGPPNHTSISENNHNNKNAYSIYPNPVNDWLHIDYIDSIRSLLLFDINGNQIFETVATYKFSVANLSRGIYYLKLIDVTGTIVSKKFVKE